MQRNYGPISVIIGTVDHNGNEQHHIRIVQRDGAQLFESYRPKERGVSSLEAAASAVLMFGLNSGEASPHYYPVLRAAAELIIERHEKSGKFSPQQAAACRADLGLVYQYND